MFKGTVSQDLLYLFSSNSTSWSHQRCQRVILRFCTLFTKLFAFKIGNPVSGTTGQLIRNYSDRKTFQTVNMCMYIVLFIQFRFTGSSKGLKVNGNSKTTIRYPGYQIVATIRYFGHRIGKTIRCLQRWQLFLLDIFMTIQVSSVLFYRQLLIPVGPSLHVYKLACSRYSLGAYL